MNFYDKTFSRNFWVMVFQDTFDILKMRNNLQIIAISYSTIVIGIILFFPFL